MTRQVIVEFKTFETPKEETISMEFQILSKSDIYKIPIGVHLMPSELFEERMNESMRINNRSIQKISVKEKPLSRGTLK